MRNERDTPHRGHRRGAGRRRLARAARPGHDPPLARLDYEGLDGEIDLTYFAQAEEDPEARTLSVQEGDVIRLEPDGAATRVVLTRAPRGVNPDWDAYYGEITEGWITFLQQLRFAVERRPGAARRTLFLSGANRAGRSPEAELGLPAAGTFTTNLLGEQVKGEAWFRSEHQVGVTVDAWGDGLLVVSGVGPTEDRPDGAAMAILSTYGLDDARFAELRDRWTPWWDERFPAGGVTWVTVPPWARSRATRSARRRGREAGRAAYLTSTPATRAPRRWLRGVTTRPPAADLGTRPEISGRQLRRVTGFGGPG